MSTRHNRSDTHVTAHTRPAHTETITVPSWRAGRQHKSSLLTKRLSAPESYRVQEKLVFFRGVEVSVFVVPKGRPHAQETLANTNRGPWSGLF